MLYISRMLNFNRVKNSELIAQQCLVLHVRVIVKGEVTSDTIVVSLVLLCEVHIHVLNLRVNCRVIAVF
jgi:hypothetical protein